MMIDVINDDDEPDDEYLCPMTQVGLLLGKAYFRYWSCPHLALDSLVSCCGTACYYCLST